MIPIASLAAIPVSAHNDTIPVRPNVVLIFADDMGYGDVSALNGASQLHTVNIDRLAQSGAVFTDMHASSSVSTPSRYGLLTGRYNWRSEIKEGVLNGYSKSLIRQGRRTIGHVMRDAGYSTACIGKWHLGWNWSGIEAGTDSIDYSQPIKEGPTTHGFDYFYGIAASLDMPPYVYVENDRATALPDRTTGNSDKFTWWRNGATAPDFIHRETLPHLIDKAEKYIRTKAEEHKPFFLYLPLPAPHTPILPSDEYLGKSGLNPYGDFVLMVDGMVGRITKTLEEAGIVDETIVIFSTDNGCSPEADIEELAEKGHHPSYIYRGYKADLYDGGHRIPCIASWRGNISPHEVGQTFCLTDFYATLASLTNQTLCDEEGEDSYDMLPLLLGNGEGEIVREATVHSSINGDFTIRQGVWKLLLSPSSGGWSYPRPGRDDNAISELPRVQLYNMAEDPGEMRNVYMEHPDVVSHLRQLLLKYIRDGRSTRGKPQHNDGPETWAQLWWADE